MITSVYRALSVNERINLRSGFDIATAGENGNYNRLVESTKIADAVIAKKISQRVYNIDRFYCSLRTLI